LVDLGIRAEADINMGVSGYPGSHCQATIRAVKLRTGTRGNMVVTA